MSNFPYAIYNIAFDLKRDRDDLSSLHLAESFRIKLNTPTDAYKKLTVIYDKLIRHEPRKIYYSKNFSCPDEHTSGLNKLLRGVSLGVNINLNLSKQVFNPDFFDGMFLEFGLYHFHLGENYTKDKLGNTFAGRTGPLLIAHVTEKGFYCLKVASHGQDLWTDEKLVEIIHDEWPQLISSFKLNRDVIKPQGLSPKERANLRSNRINTPLVMSDGTLYFPTGGGFNTLGFGSMDSSMRANRNDRQIAKLQNSFIQDVAKSCINMEEVFPAGKIDLKLLTIPDNDILAIDLNTSNVYYTCGAKQLFLSLIPSNVAVCGGTSTGEILSLMHAALKINKMLGLSLYWTQAVPLNINREIDREILKFPKKTA